MGKLDGKVGNHNGRGTRSRPRLCEPYAGLGAKVAVTDLNLHSYEEFEAGRRT
jgi:hypothetical protein